jgi:hypothetical protein
MCWKDHLSIYSLLSQNLGGKVKGALTSGLSLLCAVDRRLFSSSPLRRLIHRSDLKVATTMENAPGDAGDFVGESNRQLKAIQPPGCGLNP